MSSTLLKCLMMLALASALICGVDLYIHVATELLRTLSDLSRRIGIIIRRVESSNPDIDRMKNSIIKSDEDQNDAVPLLDEILDNAEEGY